MVQQIRNTSCIFSSEIHPPKTEFYEKIMCFQPLKYGLCGQKSLHLIDIFQKFLEMCVSQSSRKVTPLESMPFVHFERSEHNIAFLLISVPHFNGVKISL